MLVFYFYNRKLSDHLRVALVLLPVSFGLLLGESPNHLENIFTLIEVTLIILHKFRWRGTTHSLLHPQELMAAE